MHAVATLFDVETVVGTIVVTPLAGWFGLAGDDDEAEVRALLQQLDAQPGCNVVIDLGQTTDCDSSALGFCMRVWKQVRGRHGRVALCGVSENERQALRVTKLDRLWTVYASRQEALAAFSV